MQLTEIKCKNCGASSFKSTELDTMVVLECEYCGSLFEIPNDQTQSQMNIVGSGGYISTPIINYSGMVVNFATMVTPTGVYLPLDKYQNVVYNSDE